jgi:hypothetical protein
VGYSLGWVAIHGADPQSVLAALLLRRTGEREDLPKSPNVGASLPGDWFIVVTQRRDYTMDAELMEGLSTGPTTPARESITSR